MSDIVNELQTACDAFVFGPGTMIYEARAEITRLREALSSETAAREKAERRVEGQWEGWIKADCARRAAEATIADLTSKLEAAAVAWKAVGEDPGIETCARGYEAAQTWNRLRQILDPLAAALLGKEKS